MLVLSRKVGERLVINDNIVVVVTKVQGNRVTLGIEAPPEVPVRRQELKPHDPNQPPPAEQPPRHNHPAPTSKSKQSSKKVA